MQVLRFGAAVRQPGWVWVMRSRPTPLQASGEVLAVGLGGARIADLDAEEWLATTPLMRAIERETRRR